MTKPMSLPWLRFATPRDEAFARSVWRWDRLYVTLISHIVHAVRSTTVACRSILHFSFLNLSCLEVCFPPNNVGRFCMNVNSYFSLKSHLQASTWISMHGENLHKGVCFLFLKIKPVRLSAHGKETQIPRALADECHQTCRTTSFYQPESHLLWRKTTFSYHLIQPLMFLHTVLQMCSWQHLHLSGC